MITAMMSTQKKEDDHDDHGHDDHGHGHGSFDPHIWLDPANAKVIVKKITNQLSKIDKDNASTYKANSKKVIKDLDGLIKEVKNEINKDASFVVFHDAYQYFEKRFGFKCDRSVNCKSRCNAWCRTII